MYRILNIGYVLIDLLEKLRLSSGINSCETFWENLGKQLMTLLVSCFRIISTSPSR